MMGNVVKNWFSNLKPRSAICIQGVSCVRGDPFITFAPRGGGGGEKWPIMRTIRLIGCVKMRTRGEGAQNPENFANVTNGCPLSVSGEEITVSFGSRRNQRKYGEGARRG